MGGGPKGSHRFLKCILTFPKVCNIEPITLDGIYLMAMGIPLLKKMVSKFIPNRKFGVLSKVNTKYHWIESEVMLHEKMNEAMGDKLIVLHVMFKPKADSSLVKVKFPIDRYSPELYYHKERPMLDKMNKPSSKSAADVKPSGRSADEFDGNNVASSGCNGRNLTKDRLKKSTSEASTFFVSNSWHLQAEKMKISTESLVLKPSSSNIKCKPIPEAVYGKFGKREEDSEYVFI